MNVFQLDLLNPKFFYVYQTRTPCWRTSPLGLLSIVHKRPSSCWYLVSDFQSGVLDTAISIICSSIVPKLRLTTSNTVLANLYAKPHSPVHCRSIHHSSQGYSLCSKFEHWPVPDQPHISDVETFHRNRCWTCDEPVSRVMNMFSDHRKSSHALMS